MSDDRSTFETTRARLEDIVTQVRRKDVSLEQSLDMLEEAVRLVNQCNDLIDQTSFRAPAAEGEDAASGDALPAAQPAGPTADEGEDASVEGVVIVERFEMLDADGDDFGSVELIEFVPDADEGPVEIEDDERS